MQNHLRKLAFFAVLICSALALVGWPEPEPAAQDAPGSAAVPTWSVPQGMWGSAEHGLALVPPAGWTETRRQNRDYLDRVAGSAADGNLCVVTIPNMLELDFEALVEQNRAAFENMPGLELVSMQRLELAGHDVIRTESKATHQATGAEYHCLGLAYLRAGQQVVLTLTIAADQWDEQREVAEAAIDSVVLAPF